MNPLANPYVRIALGAALSQYIAPKIIQRFVRVELNDADAHINEATHVGITAGIVTMTYIVLGMATGKPLAQAVKAS